MSPDFLAHMRDIPGSCSPAVKESHYRTWCAAQQALIAASGAAVAIQVLSESKDIDADIARMVDKEFWSLI